MAKVSSEAKLNLKRFRLTDFLLLIARNHISFFGLEARIGDDLTRAMADIDLVEKSAKIYSCCPQQSTHLGPILSKIFVVEIYSAQTGPRIYRWRGSREEEKQHNNNNHHWRRL